MDTELIIILVALGLSVLSGINGNKKKKAPGPVHSPLPEPDEEDPWSTIRKYLEQAQHQEDDPEYGEAVMQEESRGHAQANVGRPEVENTQVERLNKYAKERQTRPAAKSRLDNRNTEPAMEVKSAKGNDLLEDFDLTKAVIYSEILKPRFEDY